MRDDYWLKEKLESILRDYFPEVEIRNNIFIKFGRKARTRLGSIRKAKDGSDTAIIITGFFQEEKVPEYIIDLTIAHELCHYVHGFFSPMPKLSHYPHQGRIVDKELAVRGLAKELKLQKAWLKENWGKIAIKPRIRRVRRVKRRNLSIFSILKEIYGS